jgi:hypothetical protein
MFMRVNSKWPILSSRDLLTCFNARDRGTCANRRSIKRQDVEARVLRAMRERFFDLGAFEEFCAGLTEDLAKRRPRTSAFGWPSLAGRALRLKPLLIYTWRQTHRVDLVLRIAAREINVR